MTEQTPVQIDAILQHIRAEFYTGTAPEKFLKDRTVLLLAITWPAAWLHGRGITWPAARYFEVIRQQLAAIKTHGTTGGFKYFPGYLTKCLQDHFAHNSDAFCDEAKRAHYAFDLALGRVMNARQLDDTREGEIQISALAQAHAVLASKKRTRKAPTADEHQGELFSA